MKQKKKIKVLILAKHLDGGTGKFLMQMTHLYQVVPGQYELLALALEKPKFRVPETGSVPLLFHRKNFRQPYYYTVTFSAFWRIVQECRWLFRRARFFHPDVILTIDAHSAFLGALYKLFNVHVMFVLTIHNNLNAVMFHKLTPLARTFMFFICKRLFVLADAVVGISQGVTLDVQRLFSLNKLVRTIYYGLPNKEKNYSKKASRVKAKYFPTLISAGRLAPQKDFENLIHAVQIARSSFPRLRLFILGDGDQMFMLRKLAASLKISDCVHFVGWQPESNEYYLRSDIFILSSHFEGFSLALLEAMRKGLPVISTDTPHGPREILSDGKFGLLVDPSNANSLAEAIILLSSHPSLYKQLSKKGYQRSRYFSEEKMLVKYHSLFISLLTKKGN